MYKFAVGNKVRIIDGVNLAEISIPTQQYQLIGKVLTIDKVNAETSIWFKGAYYNQTGYIVTGNWVVPESMLKLSNPNEI